ncbi:MAG TPA: tRNA lysidine(34) synthetase TilS [Blastocatellia bacterium]|nr:tRNA lysidine(34) synthetase TilS [Blastocatellia bacterium]
MQVALDKVRLLIERNEMFRDVRAVVVAVSGGADSVALLDLLRRILADLETPPRLHIAHLNHKLRGRESDDDAEFVRALAERLALPVSITSVEIRVEAEASKRGIEEVAREARYSFLLKVAAEHGCSHIATGHTMNDQAETFLMRLVRGAGLRGLAAMRPVSPVPRFGEEYEGSAEGETGREGVGASDEQQIGEHTVESAESPSRRIAPSPTPSFSPLLLRPLLCLTREEVEEYCRDRALEFRVDPSNLETHYTRNKVRLEVLPLLQKLNPRIIESLARAAELSAVDQDALDQLACKMLDEARETSGERQNRPEQGAGHKKHTDRSSYRVAALLQQPGGLRRRMIIEAIARQRISRGGPRETSSSQIDFSHVAAVEALLENEMSGKRITLPNGLEAWREFDNLVFTSARDVDQALPAYRLEISAEGPLVEAGGLQLTLEWQCAGALEVALDQAKRLKRMVGGDWMMAALDRSSLPSRMIVRPRRKGERAHVVGQPKTKKLKKLMIDHRIPPSLRELWPVVSTPDDRYVWSPGLPPGLEFAASDETVGLAILRASGA